MVVRLYTYEPFGELLESGGTLTNPFMFTGQYYDSEIGQYYLRARMYDPIVMRFTARDPVAGKFKEPLTLHQYLYCFNDPINRTDPTGELSFAELFTTQTLMKSLRGSMLGATSGAYKWSRGGSWTDVVGGMAGGAVGGFSSAWFGGYGLIAKVAVATVSEMAAHSVGHLPGGSEKRWFWEAGKREEFVANILAGLTIENLIGRVDFDPSCLPGAGTVEAFRWEEARVFSEWITNLIWGEGSEYAFSED